MHFASTNNIAKILTLIMNDYLFAKRSTAILTMVLRKS